MKIEPKFLHDFSTGITSVVKEYDLAKSDLEGVNILLASYCGAGSYEGYSVVFFEKDGDLFYTSTSHCSCFGLESGWNPNKITIQEIEDIIKMADNDPYHDIRESCCLDELKEIISILKKNGHDQKC